MSTYSRILQTPSLATLEHSGLTFRVEEAGYAYTADDLVLALWREGDAVGSDGLPLYWKSVLLARPGYDS